MTKQRLIIVVAVVLIVLSIGVLGYVGLQMFGRQSPGSTQPLNPFGGILNPGGSTTYVPKTMSVHARSGEAVMVPNVLSGKEPLDTPGGRFYNLYGPEYSTEGFTFSIQYSESDSQFLIILIAEPIGAARLEAQTYLRNLLALSDSELCSLNTIISVTPDVSEVYSQYENLGLSFCPGAVKLP
ncbi:MAG: hypothetical protein AAB737_00125 [Patescibacteria group bacterium]